MVVAIVVVVVVDVVVEEDVVVVEAVEDVDVGASAPVDEVGSARASLPASAAGGADEAPESLVLPHATASKRRVANTATKRRDLARHDEELE